MEQLLAGARHLGLTLTDKQLALFHAFSQEIQEWNQRFNLTAIMDYHQVQIRHFVDSLSCLLAFDKQLCQSGQPIRCIDVGSGAGFPGLPLKIYSPRMRMVLLEATGKKVQFLEHVTAHLGLQHVQPLKGRAEHVSHNEVHRENYDLVMARAVAALPVLAEYTLPFCRLGGLVVAQKGTSAQEETQAAEHAIELLGGRLRSVIPVTLIGLSEERNLVVIEKIARTPIQYPRRPGIPAKRPLSAHQARSGSS